jgi:twitching motility two-component system response regulator PilH
MATIVVIEDDSDVLELSALLLRKAGHTTIPATDGAQGWRAVLQHRPDLVVSDVDMPEMDGLELCVAIRANPATARLPVICISGVLLPGDDRIERAGATLLYKPFTAGELMACVDRMLAGSSRTAVPG